MHYRVKDIRKEKGFTQEELAKRAHICRATLSNLETGKRNVTSTATLDKVAKALDVKLKDIFM